TEQAASVDIVHRRDVFRAHEGSVESLRKSSVGQHMSSEVTGVIGKDGLEAVQITDKKTGAVKNIPCDYLLVAFGFKAALGPIADWGMQLENSQVIVDQNMETSIPGVYAAGDIVAYHGKVKMFVSAFSEAVTAVNHLKQRLDPEASLQPTHSSHSGPGGPAAKPR
ncbi:MAG: NAD(P)/FAD-dependent oxidoreductase, partial [Thermaerobacterales bacterium]